MTIDFTLNAQKARFNGSDETPLLWVIREKFGLTGTKFGCGKGLCGACTVHIDGRQARSCSVTINAVSGRKVLTIEGLGTAETPHPVQQAWYEIDVPQCCFCQPGQIMAAASMLAESPKANDAEIDGAITNICRCGTYNQIRSAIRRAQELIAADMPEA